MENGAFAITREELERMAELSGIEFEFRDADETAAGVEADAGDATAEADARHEANALLRELGEVALTADGDAFAQFAAENGVRIRELAPLDHRIAELLVLGYKFGISSGSAACMNNLGALYYLGDLVEQDYAKAAELYEMAAEHGCHQALVNLGYIHEYGRLGEKDLERAYRCYALAAALVPSCEATYKLGDMYSRGITGRRDLPKAKALWERSLELADGIVETAQPAIRIAGLLIDPVAQEQGIEHDPLRALGLFQQAEIGLRIDISVNGLTYYEKRLQEAIEGQERARELVEFGGHWLE